MNKAIIRFARVTDTEEILNIYEPYIKDTVITFEYDIPSREAFKQRILNISSEYPYLVCQIENSLVGYAYAHKHMERAAYQWNAELSIYLERTLLRRGIGKALFASLIEILKLQNIQNLYSIVTSPNPNSEGIHDYFGFTKIGVFHNSGYKFGAWHDVIWYEKGINPHEIEPKSFLPIKEVNQDKISEILAKYAAAIKSN